MTKQITLEEALELVSFYHSDDCGWRIRAVWGNVYGFVDGDVKGYVKGDVIGNVEGNVTGNVRGAVCGNVEGDVWGTVFGNVDGYVYGKINGREWESVETPKDKIQQFIEESGNQELIDAFNQMEDN